MVVSSLHRGNTLRRSNTLRLAHRDHHCRLYALWQFGGAGYFVYVGYSRYSGKQV